MLTIAGSGINYYSLKELSSTLNFYEFDCIVLDVNFDTPENRALMPSRTKANFLLLRDIGKCIKENLLLNQNVLYIVTGSPLYFSATGEILKFLDKEMPGYNKINILPAESSKDYLLRKMRILDNEVTSLSLHGRNLMDLTKFLSSKYTFILCDEFSLSKIAEDTRFIKDDLVFYIGSKLGSPSEKIEVIDIDAEQKQDIFPYVILIERKYDSPSAISATEDFRTNAGMITKTDKRSITLQALDLKPNLLMWDIGAGSGSISIDAYKVFRVRTVLFEKNKAQCAFIKENLASHKVAGAQLIEGYALDNLHKASMPDRIFIGGGGEEVLSEIELLYNELKTEGVIVANIIGLENLAQTVNTLKNLKLNPEIRSIDIINYKKINENINLSIPEPQRTLFQLILKKKGN